MKKTFFFLIIFLLTSFKINCQTLIGESILGEASDDYSGRSVSLSSDGSIVAIGAYENDGNGTNSGHVRIYEWNGSAWTQKGSDIDGEASGDYSGYSVSLSSDGSIVAIGAYENNGNGSNSGHVRIYQWNGSAWTQKGSDINGEAASDHSGRSVSLSSDGSIVAIGANLNDGNGISSGHVRIYEWSGSAWTQKGSDINGEASGDQSGTSVSLSSDGSIVAIGATGNDGNGDRAGHVRIYEWNGTAWTQRGSDIDGEAAGDFSGRSVSLSSDGSIVAIGATQIYGNGTNSGHVRIYEWSGSAWTQKGSYINGEAASDYSGDSVSLSSDGSIVAIGALYNDGNGTNSGHVRVFSLTLSVNNHQTIASDINLDVNINSSGSLTLNGDSSINGDVSIADGGELTLNGSGTISGSVTISNNGSLIITDGSVTGNIIYNRTLSTLGSWYLISSPVVGETYDNAYVTANSIASGIANTNNRAIAPYNTSDDTWDYMQAGESATFIAGTGYAVKRTTVGDISFTGTMNTDNTGVDIVLSNAGNRFNLLGNPYPSHIASAIFLANESAISESQTLWVWDQENGYEVKIIGDSFVVAPGQGFFVKANTAGGTFNFSESNQVSSGGTFQRTNARPEILLSLSNQTDFREAKIYYVDNMTTGFDVGYEGEMFNGVSNPFAIYTHLVSNSEGKNYQVQSLPPDNYENMVIPVGINAGSGTTISIEVSTVNFPEGMNVYLEDKENDSFTLLDGDANFTTTLASDLNGIGRFFLHTTTSSLSADDLLMTNNISIYNSSKENLRIVGVQNGTAKVQLYNILGKEVFNAAFEGTGVNDIQLPSLAEGLYIVNLSTVNGKTKKKIIISTTRNEQSK